MQTQLKCGFRWLYLRCLLNQFPGNRLVCRDKMAVFCSMLSRLVRFGGSGKLSSCLCKRHFATGVAFANRLACWNELFPCVSPSSEGEVGIVKGIARNT